MFLFVLIFFPLLSVYAQESVEDVEGRHHKSYYLTPRWRYGQPSCGGNNWDQHGLTEAWHGRPNFALCGPFLNRNGECPKPGNGVTAKPRRATDLFWNMHYCFLECGGNPTTCPQGQECKRLYFSDLGRHYYACGKYEDRRRGDAPTGEAPTTKMTQKGSFNDEAAGERSLRGSHAHVTWI